MTTATINRIKQYVEQPQSKPNRNTAAMYGTVVMAALETMHGLMTGFDNELAFKAASAILEIEKARLRHKMPLAGVHTSQQERQPEAMDERTDQSTSTLTDTETKQFEKAVDEFTVVLNKKQTEEGQETFPRAVLREQYKKKLTEVGFGEFLSWHGWMVGRSETSGINPLAR